MGLAPGWYGVGMGLAWAEWGRMGISHKPTASTGPRAPGSGALVPEASAEVPTWQWLQYQVPGARPQAKSANANHLPPGVRRTSTSTSAYQQATRN
jgi:hypothetical protein